MFFGTIALSLLLAVSSNPTELDDIAARADAAYAKRDYLAAAPLYQQLADSGRADAMTRLGSLCEKGQGLAYSDSIAVVWFRKAAGKGHPLGMTKLGRMYEDGRGVTKDYAEAVAWFRRAIAMGDPAGMMRLGVMYAEGRGVERDVVQAVGWYRKAAEAGDPEAMATLGSFYHTGRGGVTQDDAQAVVWYRRSAEKSDAFGMFNLGLVYRDGLGVAPDDVQAAAWFRRSADGDTDEGALGMLALGGMYEEGRGVARDNTQALAWYRKAAEFGNSSAKDNLKKLAQKLGMEPLEIQLNYVAAPVAIHRVEPKYSKEARRAKFQGTVVVQIVIDETGQPRDFKVVRSIGFGLDEKAVEAVKQWRFRPGIRDGKPVAVLAKIEVNFRLRQN